MALTVLEMAKQETGNTHRRAIIEMFARAHPLMQAFPFNTIQGNAYSYEQEAVLPAVGFRGVNEAFSEDAGVVNPLTERIVIAGGDLDVDKFIVQTQGSEKRAQRVAMKVKNLAHTIAHKFIKGDADTDPKEFDGLQKRVTGSQLIDVKQSSPTNGGDPLGINRLHEAIDAVDDPTHLAMSKAMRRHLTIAAHDTTVGGYVTYSKNEFGQPVTSFRDLPILEMDGGQFAYQTLGFNEVGAGGANATATSIYCMSLQEGMLSGLQNGTLEARDLGELDEKPVFRTRVEWLVGMAVEHGRSVSRLRGISDAGVIKTSN